MDEEISKILGKVKGKRDLRKMLHQPAKIKTRFDLISEESQREISRQARILQAYENTGIAREDLFRCNFKTWENKHLTPEFYRVYEFCKQWDPNKSPHGLVLCGLPGVGKTHLLQALLIKHSGPERQGLFLDWQQVLANLRSEFSKDTGYRRDLLVRIGRKKIVLLDEIAFGGSKEYAEDFLRQVLNKMITKGIFLFGTSNKTEAQLKAEFGKPEYDRIREISEFYDLNIKDSFRKTINHRNTRIFREMIGE